jgi:hypothetical protein
LFGSSCSYLSRVKSYSSIYQPHSFWTPPLFMNYSVFESTIFTICSLLTLCIWPFKISGLLYLCFAKYIISRLKSIFCAICGQKLFNAESSVLFVIWHISKDLKTIVLHFCDCNANITRLLPLNVVFTSY